jgi:hypothetical protein
MPVAKQISLTSLSFCLIALGTCIGCNGGLATIEGKVNFDGEPVEQGTIVFEPTDGTGAVAGGNIQNGKYRLGPESKLAPGNKIVRISAMRSTGKKIKAGPPAPDDAMVDEVQQFIPTNYNEKSTLTAQIVPGNGIQNFDLQSK